MLIRHKAVAVQNRAAVAMCMKKMGNSIKYDRPDSRLVCT